MMKHALAALLAATPMLAPARAETPAASSAVAPTRFSVVVEGQGPDVILIPGLSSTRAVWKDTAARLKSTHRVHLVQLRGFGEPAGVNASGPVLEPFVEELATYIRANKLRKPAVIGHSMGGLTALKLGLAAPDLPGRLMIVDALPFIGTLFGGDSVAAVLPRAGAMKAMLLAQAGKVEPDFSPPAPCAADLPPPPSPAGNMTNSGQGACLVRAGARASDLRVVAQVMAEVMATDLRSEIGKIEVPLTLVYPQDGRLVTSEEAGRLYAAAYRANPRTRMVPVKGSYHFVMSDQPATFAAALDAFLAATP